MRPKRYQRGLYCSWWLVLSLAGLACAQMKSTVYQPDETIFANPDQGFYLYRNLHTLESDVGKHRAQGLTLVWGRIDLEPYREQTDLPSAFLAQLEEGFATARDQGMKVIVRASYGHRGTGGGDYLPLSTDDLEALSGAGSYVEKYPGTHLFHEGDDSVAAYVIKSGEIELYRTRKEGSLVVGRVGPGAVIGDIALFQGRPPVATGSRYRVR